MANRRQLAANLRGVRAQISSGRRRAFYLRIRFTQEDTFMITNNDAAPGTATTAAGLANGGKHGGGSCPMVDQYEALMAPARQRFDEHPAVAALFRDRLEVKTLEAFLIYFCALGVGMTEPVEQWISAFVRSLPLWAFAARWPACRKASR